MTNTPRTPPPISCTPRSYAARITATGQSEGSDQSQISSEPLKDALPTLAPAAAAAETFRDQQDTVESAVPIPPAWTFTAYAALDQIEPLRRISPTVDRIVRVNPSGTPRQTASCDDASTSPFMAATTSPISALDPMARSTRQNFITAMVADHPDFCTQDRDRGSLDTAVMSGNTADAVETLSSDEMLYTNDTSSGSNRLSASDMNDASDLDDGYEVPGLSDVNGGDDMQQSFVVRHGYNLPVPLAVGLSDAAVAAMLAAQDDPWAIDRDTRRARPVGNLNPTDVLPLARFCAACRDQAGIDRVLSDGSATIVLCDSDAEMAALARTLANVRMATTRAPDTPDASQQCPAFVVTIGDQQGATRSTAVARACTEMKRVGALVILMTAVDDVPSVLTRLPVMPLAPVCPEVIIFNLCILQSATGRISEAAVRVALPPPAALSRIDYETLLYAFRADGPLRTAARLAELAAPHGASSSAKSVDDGPLVDDLPGLGAARTPLQGLVDDVRDHVEGRLPWSAVTSGLILAGPPGTGKTTLAAAIARSAGVPLIATTSSDWHRGVKFNDMLVAMADAFTEARRRAPAVLFIDEIDSLGSRSARADQNASYNRHVINAVLSQIDGAQGRDGVLIIGATNYPELLDPALTRPGRLGHTIHITPPSERELPDVFRHHLGRDLPQIDLAPIARSAAGATMADVMSMVQAARAATRATGRALTTADLKAAVDDRYSPVSDALRKRHAIRAAAHIAAAHITGHARPVSATLTADGARTEVQPVAHSHDPAAVSAALITTLAGRAAEAVLLGAPSGLAGGGPTSDLACATKTALTEALSLGRGDGLTWQVSDTDPALLFVRHRGLRDTVDGRLHAAYARARALIEGNRAAVDAIAAHLLVDGHVDRDTLRDLLVFCVAQQVGK